MYLFVVRKLFIACLYKLLILKAIIDAPNTNINSVDKIQRE